MKYIVKIKMGNEDWYIKSNNGIYIPKKFESDVKPYSLEEAKIIAHELYQRDDVEFSCIILVRER